ncbi:response regulator transcription factor [Desulforhopalus sp. IMCC35007]|uniref:response regulator transcription factor n=1 Tax=Desulforhopalus sp. IMCC35007 TaxID=2569543 RepID=UPI0010AE468F|nr:response regulator transcription factor [Desulforhopalus sp. IMCC35007]TKB05712.1 response regulator transcription factor [Desulforhopalus sp. IMCC35007]
MMLLLCCSKDKALLTKLSDSFGPGNVVTVADAEALKKTETPSCDVAIVDLKYFDVSVGKQFTCPVIALATLPAFPEAFAALQLGIRGYGNRQMRLSNLLQAIHSVKERQIWLPPSIISQLIDVVGQTRDTDNSASRERLLHLLSKREQEVALYVAKGLSNQEVAEKMFVSLRTVKAHLSSIYEKTGVRNRLELGLTLA